MVCETFRKGGRNFQPEEMQALNEALRYSPVLITQICYFLLLSDWGARCSKAGLSDTRDSRDGTFLWGLCLRRLPHSPPAIFQPSIPLSLKRFYSPSETKKGKRTVQFSPSMDPAVELKTNTVDWQRKPGEDRERAGRQPHNENLSRIQARNISSVRLPASCLKQRSNWASKIARFTKKTIIIFSLTTLCLGHGQRRW